MERSYDCYSVDQGLDDWLPTATKPNLAVLPLELLVYIFSFITSSRDKVKLFYISQRIRSAVETPSLWRNFTWTRFDFREERSVENVMKSCGKHMKRVSFSDCFVLPVQSLLLQCDRVVELSLPSFQLSQSHLRAIMQTMRKLKHLDILWRAKDYIKFLLQIVGCPVYGCSVNELTIRALEVEDMSFRDTMFCLLNEWVESRLTPHKINISVMAGHIKTVSAFRKWKPLPSQPANQNGYGVLKVYSRLCGLSVVFPTCQVQFTGHSFKEVVVNAREYGLGLDIDLVFTDRTLAGGNVQHKALLKNSSYFPIGDPVSSGIVSSHFLTYFSAYKLDILYSTHLEQFALACPNLQNLKLIHNVNCLKSLQGLRSIATHCQKLESLNISKISAKYVESCVQLWEILACIRQLNFLDIDFCCLVGDDHTKETIINQHKKCFKLMGLETASFSTCTDCIKQNKSLLVSSFPCLIHCKLDGYIDLIGIGEKLRYLSCLHNKVSTSCFQPVLSYSLQELGIKMDFLCLSDSFMNSISVHGGLVRVFLSVHSVTQNGIDTLIGNSPNLLTFQVYIQDDAAGDPKDLSARLQKKYSCRKLFLCGSYSHLQEKMTINDMRNLKYFHNVNLFSVWNFSSP